MILTGTMLAVTYAMVRYLKTKTGTVHPNGDYSVELTERINKMLESVIANPTYFSPLTSYIFTKI